MDELTPRPINKVALALIRDGHLLLARSQGADVFQIPGGKVEPTDADDMAALIREIDEELNLTLAPDTTRYLGLFSAPAAGQSHRMVNIKLFQGDPQGTPEPGQEIQELAWIDLTTAQSNPSGLAMSQVVETKILPFLRDQIRLHRPG